MGELNWERVLLLFPEFDINPETGKKGVIWDGYEKETNFGKNPINFLFRKEYGVQLFLEKIPDWIPLEDAKVGGLSLRGYYNQLGKKIYDGVLAELNESFETLEFWRGFVKKYDKTKGKWVGSLSDHLEFVKKNSQVMLWDYYHLNPKGDEKFNSPTSRLVEIEKIPKWITNKSLSKYRDLAEYVVESESPNSCNEIIGGSISECVKRANEIYQVAQELGELEI